MRLILLACALAGRQEHKDCRVKGVKWGEMAKAVVQEEAGKCGTRSCIAVETGRKRWACGLYNSQPWGSALHAARQGSFFCAERPAKDRFSVQRREKVPDPGKTGGRGWR